MSRRRRRVKIKSSSRLVAFILFNLLLLASCITAHYLQEQPQFGGAGGNQQLGSSLSNAAAAYLGQPRQPDQSVAAQQLGISSLAPPSAINSNLNNQQQARAASILSASHFNQFQNLNQEPPSVASYASSSPARNDDADQEDGETEESSGGTHEVMAQHQQGDSGSLQHHHQQQQQHYSSANAALLSVSNLCAQLPNSRHLKLCKLIGRSPNADETVAVGAARGLAECRNQFRSDRWNCTHAAGDHHLLTSKLAQSVGNRESGFVQAIAAAGIVHSIATACSVGSLSDCACDKTRVGLIRQKDQIWKWGGCSNNIRHGMMFAKHLVELLDAVHEHARQQQHRLNLMQQQQQPHQQHHHLTERQLQRRSLSSRHSEPNQLRGRSSNQLESALLATPAELLQQQQQMLNFCQKNQNISQTTQIQLIKSLLSKNSLERHQDFRLAMNMHNNKVGRMAVARNMEIKCRCHGLSGSCSLKTCWLRLPDFQQIGAYLKRKYDGSIHLPTAVNVNRLIPMMDKQELSAILLQNNQHEHEQQSNQVAPLTPPAPEFAALTSGEQRAQQAPPAAINPTGSSPPLSPPAPTTVPPHFDYYERHKQLERMTAAAATTAKGQPLVTISGGQNQSATVQMHGGETVAIVPMSQQQYQALLRDMKLCNSNANSSSRSPGHLHKRDLVSGSELPRAHQSHQQPQHHSQHHRSKSHHSSNTKRLHHEQHAGGAHHQQPQQHHHHLLQHQAHQHHQQLIGQLLNSQNRDDLVHLHKSPDYCEADLRHGFAGVQARTCSQDPLASNSCDKLCCGRGYETRETQIRYNCDCKFQYCCKIHCNYCHKKVVEYVCK